MKQKCMVATHYANRLSLSLRVGTILCNMTLLSTVVTSLIPRWFGTFRRNVSHLSTVEASAIRRFGFVNHLSGFTFKTSISAFPCNMSSLKQCKRIGKLSYRRRKVKAFMCQLVLHVPDHSCNKSSVLFGVHDGLKAWLKVLQTSCSPKTSWRPTGTVRVQNTFVGAFLTVLTREFAC